MTPTERHLFNPDLLGDCIHCPLPEDNPAHVVDAPPENAPPRVTAATESVEHVSLDPRSHARATDPVTSLNAATGLTDKATMMRRLLGEYTLAAEWGTAGGLTAEEAADAAGYSAEDGAWKRVSDLKRAGWIEPTGRTRPGSSGRQQAVCAITDAGRKALR